MPSLLIELVLQIGMSCVPVVLCNLAKVVPLGGVVRMVCYLLDVKDDDEMVGKSADAYRQRETKVRTEPFWQSQSEMTTLASTHKPPHKHTNTQTYS